MATGQRARLAERAIQNIHDRSARIAVVGQGYVGLPVAMRAAEMGFSVVGFDTSAERVKSLAAGSSYIGDVSDTEVRRAVESGYLPTNDPTDLTGFDVAVISVPTPLREGLPDLGYIEAAGRDLARHLRPGACVVLESTTYPGTTTELLLPLLVDGSGLEAEEFFLGHSPERIDPGNPSFGLVNT
ncbi:MAG: NAD(P)-binding domain-containing protein, partial [Actinomycetota bacterium]